MKNSILIVEDDVFVRESLFEILKAENYEVTLAPNGQEGKARLGDKVFDIILTDLRLPDMSGLDFLKAAREKLPETDVVIMTSFGTIENAVEAMKLGASHYLTKPINDEEIKILLRRLIDTRKLKAENQQLKEELMEKKTHFHNLVGSDSKMQKIYSIIHAIRETDTTVLLVGESGTGKGMIAQAIHYSDPARKDGPYIEVPCGAIPRELVESELFGHVRGAFTSAIRDRAGRFELANGGTILLDEIDTLPPYLQVKLLRVLQQKTFERVGDTKTLSVNVRIIAATNRNIEEEIKKGNFREDLYYRLNVITVQVPPLRDRREDIPALIDHFIQVFNQKMKRQIREISKEVMKFFMTYDWPGNIRELENLLERACVLAQGEVLTLENFPDNFIQRQAAAYPSVTSSHVAALKDTLREPEKRIIVEALEQSGWNRKKAATKLNINRTTLYNKMKKHNLL